MSKGAFPEFREALGYRESSNRYEAVNPYGYLGKYQMGRDRLIDLGLRNKAGWLWGLDEDRFLANAYLQEATFVAHVARHLADIDRRHSAKFGMMVDGTVISASGLVAAAHLVGMGAVSGMLRTGTMPKDGFGTTALEYLERFGDYDLPRDMPRDIPRNAIF